MLGMQRISGKKVLIGMRENRKSLSTIPFYWIGFGGVGAEKALLADSSMRQSKQGGSVLAFLLVRAGQSTH